MGRIACNAEDWNNQSQPGTRPACHTCLTPGQAIGLAFSTQAGSISFASVVLLFAVIVTKYYLASPGRRKRLFNSHLDVYMCNLFICELLMSLGGVLDAKWAHETQVYCGGYCNAQASLQFLGETSVSIWTLAITLHTGWSVVYAKRLNFRPWFCFGVVAAVWIYVFAFNFGAYASVNPVDDDDPANYFAPTPFWCWIGPAYGTKKFAEYIWLWIAGVGNIVVYVPLFLLLRGNIVLGNDGDLRSAEWHTTPQPPRTFTVKSDSTSTLSAEDEGDVRDDCWKMLYYPAAYTVLVLPLSVVRWMGFADTRFADPQLPTMTSFGTATLVFHALYRLSGVINVVLVLGTRPNVLLLGKRSKDEDEDEEDEPQPADGERNAANGALLRQRTNATQPMEQVGGNSTGFGGPVTDLRRGED
ncbi:hypothetical protein FRC10_011852 [Ceratobasidium sp. 414]|nr:hypothetical protein FRC10_011852 [Ceratobasidium sp. 414]